jgi:hypothetical protein
MPRKDKVQHRLRMVLLCTATALTPMAGHAATILDWNTANVAVDLNATPGVTGTSEVYDRALNPDGSVPAGAQTSGTITFAPPEAGSPGIKVQSQTYGDTGASATLELSGCLMTSNPAAVCTSPFQSGKRIKQNITGFAPVDLVFDIDSANTGKEAYQVFGRLINDSGLALEGVKVELGFGVGADFVAATTDQLVFSTEFTAQPNNSGLSSTSQMPFGLFGDASDNDNFLLDGFFASARTGFELDQTDHTIETAGYYGDYESIFGDWNTKSNVAQGLFWDFDNNADTDNLLMAWQIGPDEWELRRIVGETCDPLAPLNCTFGQTLDPLLYQYGTFDEIVDALSDPNDPWLDVFGDGAIEDLANLNLNYALELGDLTGYDSFTIRTTATPAAIPLPAGAPLLLGALGLLGFVRKRKTA